MEAFPTNYVRHNLPLTVLSGLGSLDLQLGQDPEYLSYPLLREKGVKIGSELPPVTTPTANELLKEFIRLDGSDAPWNSRLDEGGSSMRLSVKAIGRLKIEINNIKRAFTASGYKTRFVVVLFSEKSILNAEIDERLTIIRRATGLDAKNSLFFVPPNSSTVELRAFVENLITTLQPLCIEYYRELTKKTRRKKNRASIPPPTAPSVMGTSQTLSGQGWNIRYDFKLGVLSEFRQEMESAKYHFEAAYDGLLGPDVIETIVTWDPRWNEARLLADVLAIRIIRALLWNGESTSAVRVWRAHIHRVQDLMDRRGKGSTNYGWEAWVARWDTIMAQLIQRTGVMSLVGSRDLKNNEPPLMISRAIYMLPEKTIPVGTRLFPWDLLHHPGYWLNEARKHTQARRDLAEDISDDDRVPPDYSVASRLPSKSYAYDTYLCSEPYNEVASSSDGGVDYLTLILNFLSLAVEEFQQRDQFRAVQGLRLDLAREYMRGEQWNDALSVLKPLWRDMTWRKEGWWIMVEETCWAIQDCARHVNDGGTFLATEWELLSDVFSSKPDRPYNLMECLNELKPMTIKPTVTLNDEEVTSFLSAAYAFEDIEGNVSKPLASQLAISSRAVEGSAPISFSEIKLSFEGSLRTIVLSNQAASNVVGTEVKDGFQLAGIDLSEATFDEAVPNCATSGTSTPSMRGVADLTIAPGQVKILNFVTIFREAGDVRLVSVAFSIKQDLFQMEYIQNIKDSESSATWWNKGRYGPTKKRLGRSKASAVKILPRLPRMQIAPLPEMKDQFYTDEKVAIGFEVVNEEDEVVEAALETRLLSHSDAVPELIWDTEAYEGFDVPDASFPKGTRLPGHAIGVLVPQKAKKEIIAFSAKSDPTDYILEIRLLYQLHSDLNTPLSKTLTINIAIVSPFEANYDFFPRLLIDKWPSYFRFEDDQPYFNLVESPNGTEPKPNGIPQQWGLAAKVASFATERLIIEGMSVTTLGIIGAAKCSISQDHPDNSEPMDIAPNGLIERSFLLNVQTLTPEDRRSAAVDLMLQVRWRRAGIDSKVNISSLSVPRLLVPIEPRVLVSARRSASISSLILLDYTLENPSMHILTFNVSMEVSEDFAFSGPKLSSLQLVPLSRHTIHFILLPAVKGQYIRPLLHVTDRYFNKTLRITATEGIKTDKKGILVWVD
ncbi:MAG: hypothetical protein M1827_006522 [Pycnora praestabilis]|nr:MAG: hypothetical protein M1827_006522 [Pycnora praestabilis]